MVGTERANWYSQHPSACTCAECTEKRKLDKDVEAVLNYRKIGRNEMCPCGSNKKYKKCHG